MSHSPFYNANCTLANKPLNSQKREVMASESYNLGIQYPKGGGNAAINCWLTANKHQKKDNLQKKKKTLVSGSAEVVEKLQEKKLKRQSHG
ncbi:unnamed protein product [Pleuronectes platessa]|uniref:Uncharacterized protein n=1 Tax=Pleuronectes platessa TaxID=8262 RepID=A0A9N7ZCQ3_PLEPL|nr:unnamed protein product [Pleuronectes platessa]